MVEYYPRLWPADGIWPFNVPITIGQPYTPTLPPLPQWPIVPFSILPCLTLLGEFFILDGEDRNDEFVDGFNVELPT